MKRLDGDFARRCAGLRQAACLQVGDDLLNTPLLSRRAAGTEPSGVDDYACGDDYRYVDWNRAARLDELVTKRFYGNERRRLLLLLDVSLSMSFGRPDKFDTMRELAAALGYASLARYDELSMVGFSEAVSATSGPLCGIADAARSFRFLENLKPRPGTTNLSAAVRWIVERHDAVDLVVVLSDLFAQEGFVQPLDWLRQRGVGVHVIQFYALEDAQPELAGRIRFADIETDDSFSATIDESDIENYGEVFDEFCQSVRTYCAGRGVACTQLCSDTSLAAAFAAVAQSSQNVFARRASA